LAIPEVIAVRDAVTLQSIRGIIDRSVAVALFVRIGTTRLLDKRVISPRGNIA
jgi:pantoate--beta-alanine ligase